MVLSCVTFVGEKLQAQTHLHNYLCMLAYFADFLLSVDY